MSPSSEFYVPKQGDAVWLDFNPQLGREHSPHEGRVLAYWHSQGDPGNERKL